MQTKEMASVAEQTLSQAQSLVDTIPGVKKMFEENTQGESSKEVKSQESVLDPTSQD
jgi:hypothetical protein